jgi:hypothetical protein
MIVWPIESSGRQSAVYCGCSRSDFPGGTGARDIVRDGLNCLFFGLLGFFLALRGVNK